MTDTEKQCQVGRVYLELAHERRELAQLRERLNTFQQQVKMVARDWDDLGSPTGTLLVMATRPDHDRPLPGEAEIASVLHEIAKREAAVNTLTEKLKALAGA